MLDGVPNTVPRQRHDDQMAVNHLFSYRFNMKWLERKNPLAKSTYKIVMHGVVDRNSSGGVWNASQPLALTLLPNSIIVRNSCEPKENHSFAVAVHCRTVG